MDRSKVIARDALSSLIRMRAELGTAVEEPALRAHVLKIVDQVLVEPAEYITRCLLTSHAQDYERARPEEEQLRTFVKVHGTYPREMATFSRYKDRALVHIGTVHPVPEHSISIEMIPLLREFRSLSDALDLEGLARGGTAGARPV